MLLIFSLEIIFASDLFVSKLAKYLLFFSPCSTVSAFERSINPCNVFFCFLFLMLPFFLLNLILVFQFFHDLMFPKYTALILKFHFPWFRLVSYFVLCMGGKFNSFISDCVFYYFPKSIWICISIY